MAKKKTKKNSNPIQDLADIYHSQVEEADKKGFAEDLKCAASYWFLEIKENIEKLKNTELPTISFIDIEYLDGYFIIGRGSNTIVHFYIKECPGWKFGIWWEDPEETESKGHSFKGSFFAQYELAIDKFKPSRSAINIEFSLDLDTYNTFSLEMFHTIPKTILFIHQHPELAFCRDYCDWDYNLEYHTEEEAEKEFKNYLEHDANEKKYTTENNDKILNFFQNKIIPYLFPQAEILDRGENWIPRYSIAIPYGAIKYSDTKEKIPCGCYNIFIEDEEPDDEYFTEYKQILKECEEKANKYNFHWFSPIDPTFSIYHKSTLKELKKINKGDNKL